jgi:hypothetical protein
MIERGSFRAIYCALVDGPDFQAFSPGAKLVFYTLKMTLGPSGIDVVPALVATLVERTGADTTQIEKALAQLESAGWVKRERNVIWIVDGLRHEPSFSLTNQNHRQKVRNHLDGLPRLGIVDDFRRYYSIAPPPSEIPSPAPAAGVEDATEIPPKMASKDPSKNTEEGRGKREEGSRSTDKDSAGARRRRGGDGLRGGKPTWLTPFAEAWHSVNGGTMAAGKAVKALAKLVEEWGADEVLRRWKIYVTAKGEYANAPGFASTWGRWNAPPRLVATNGARPSKQETGRAAMAEWLAQQESTGGALVTVPADDPPLEDIAHG